MSLTKTKKEKKVKVKAQQENLTASLAFFREVYKSCNGTDHGILLCGGHAPENRPDMARWVIMGLRPKQILESDGRFLTFNGDKYPIKNAKSVMNAIERLLEKCETWEVEDKNCPFHGGVTGYFGYEFARWCDIALQTAPKRQQKNRIFPEFLLYEFQDWLIVDQFENKLITLSHDQRQKDFYDALWQEISTKPPKEMAPLNIEAYPDPLSFGFQASLTPEEFEKGVDSIKTKIKDGEFYQANLSIRFHKYLTLDPFDVYDNLYRINPSPFSGLFFWPDGAIVCNSPERLISVDENRFAETRPIAGTRGRGETQALEDEISETLLTDPKEQAEHMMMVDMERNDLGRIAEPGTMSVSELKTLERYSHVTHLVSNITGTLRDNVKPTEVVQSMFPGGTITGCPKIRVIETLRELEPVPRGPYTGSLGYIDAKTGAMDLNILIRSIYLQATRLPFVYNTAIHVGAGIVADSVGEYEYRECLRKAAAVIGVLQANQTSETL